MIEANELSEIQQFYAGQNILITGATGFLGRVLLEKLLRSCRAVGKIYLLIRPKKGKSSHDRLNALFDDVVFDLLKREFPDFVKKIVGIDGDIMTRGLGLSAEDRARIVDEVRMRGLISIIFHVAATVRFNEILTKAVAINVNSVKEIVDLGRECKNLKAGVYMSTAYSNCVRKTIGEKLYVPPLSYTEVNQIIEIAEKRGWSEKMVRSVTKELIGEWPNSYTFTKAIAEGVISEYASDLPFGVFRPSIVTGCYKEPIRGWTSGFIGVNALFVAVGLGALRVVEISADARPDLVPVDMSCNASIACAWKIAKTRERFRQCENTNVYNYVSVPENPITWLDIYKYGVAQPENYGSTKNLWYPGTFFTKSEMLFKFLNFFLHLVPVIICDMIARMIGKDPIFYNIYCKGMDLSKDLRRFRLEDWNFENDNVQNLWNELNDKDKIIFPFTVRSIVWRDYMSDFFVGLRRYILKESDEMSNKARRRLQILYILNQLVRAMFAAFVLWIVWKLYSWVLR